MLMSQPGSLVPSLEIFPAGCAVFLSVLKASERLQWAVLPSNYFPSLFLASPSDTIIHISEILVIKVAFSILMNCPDFNHIFSKSFLCLE